MALIHFQNSFELTYFIISEILGTVLTICDIELRAEIALSEGVKENPLTLGDHLVKQGLRDSFYKLTYLGC